MARPSNRFFEWQAAVPAGGSTVLLLLSGSISTREILVLQLQRARVTPLDTALSGLRRLGTASLSVSLERLLEDVPDPVQKLLQRHALGRSLAVLTRRGSGFGGRGRGGGLVAAGQCGGNGADVRGESAGGEYGGQVCDDGADDWVHACGGDDAG